MFGLADNEACFFGSQSRGLVASDRFQESDSRENVPDGRALAAWKLEATGSPSASGPRDNRSFKNIQLTCQFASQRRESPDTAEFVGGRRILLQADRLGSRPVVDRPDEKRPRRRGGPRRRCALGGAARATSTRLLENGLISIDRRSVIAA